MAAAIGISSPEHIFVYFFVVLSYCGSIITTGLLSRRALDVVVPEVPTSTSARHQCTARHLLKPSDVALAAMWGSIVALKGALLLFHILIPQFMGGNLSLNDTARMPNLNLLLLPAMLYMSFADLAETMCALAYCADKPFMHTTAAIAEGVFAIAAYNAVVQHKADTDSMDPLMFLQCYVPLSLHCNWAIIKALVSLNRLAAVVMASHFPLESEVTLGSISLWLIAVYAIFRTVCCGDYIAAAVASWAAGGIAAQLCTLRCNSSVLTSTTTAIRRLALSFAALEWFLIIALAFLATLRAYWYWDAATQAPVTLSLPLLGWLVTSDPSLVVFSDVINASNRYTVAFIGVFICNGVFLHKRWLWSKACTSTGTSPEKGA